jgi:hypothetical protein
VQLPLSGWPGSDAGDAAGSGSDAAPACSGLAEAAAAPAAASAASADSSSTTATAAGVTFPLGTTKIPVAASLDELWDQPALGAAASALLMLFTRQSAEPPFRYQLKEEEKTSASFQLLPVHRAVMSLQPPEVLRRLLIGGAGINHRCNHVFSPLLRVRWWGRCNRLAAVLVLAWSCTAALTLPLLLALNSLLCCRRLQALRRTRAWTCCCVLVPLLA